MDAKEYIDNQKDILERLEKAEGTIKNIGILISRIGIDTQTYIRANDPIVPSVACKVAFDKNGVILRGDQLSVSDIPDLPIDKIQNLQDVLNKKADQNSQREIPTRAPKKNVIAGTGTKVNYDEDGRIVSSSDLLEDDIPELSMGKINGLLEKLKSLEYHEDKKDETEFRVTPGTFPKVTFDSSGRVLRGSNLTMNDIPSELLSKLNIYESKLLEFAPASEIDSLKESISKKLDANEYMVPGTYMKVKVDHKGLVIGYEPISLKDLPSISMSDIEGLHAALRKKANQSDFIELHESIAALASLPSKLSELTSIKSDLSKKADREELGKVSNQLTSLNSLLQSLMDKIPNDTIIEFLNQIQGSVSELSGRVAVLEKKFSEE